MGLVGRQPLVGISGFGSIGRQHLAALSAIGCERVAVFDPTSEFRAEAAAEAVVIKVVGSFEELLALGLDALVIAAPDAFHVPQLDAATAAGVPTLVEKPLAPSLAAAEPLTDIAGRGVPVLVGYVLRHRRVMHAIRAELAAGSVGDPTSFQVMLGSYGTIRAARSRFDHAEPDRLYRDYSHEWDYLRWFFGEPVRVLAVPRTTHAVPHVEQPNLVDGLLETREGVLGSFHLDYVEPRGTRTLHVVGTGGSMVADIARGTLTVYEGSHASERRVVHQETAAEVLARQAAHLLDVACGAATPAAGIVDGLAALRVTDAAVASARTASWVSLSSPGESA